MEWISSLVNGANGIYALITTIIIILLVIYIVKKGLFRYNKNGIVIGDIQARERTIIQRQTTYIHTQLDALANTMLVNHPDMDRYMTLWIFKCVEIELIRSIHYNHVTDTDGYKNDRVVAVLAIFRKKSQNPYFFSEEFEKKVEDFAATFIRKCVGIREQERG